MNHAICDQKCVEEQMPTNLSANETFRAKINIPEFWLYFLGSYLPLLSIAGAPNVAATMDYRKNGGMMGKIDLNRIDRNKECQLI